MSKERASLAVAVEGLATQIATQPCGLMRSLEVGFLCATTSALARAAFDPVLGPNLPFSMFFPALLAAALFGGARAAILALAIATVSGWFLFLPPKLSFEIASGQGVQVPIFIAVGLSIIALGLVLRSALIRLEAHRRRYEALVFELSDRLHKDLATVAELAQHSLHDAGGRRAGEALVDRLAVLREAHHDLSRLDWRPIPLGRVVERPLRYFAPTEARRIAVEGPGVDLDPDLAIALALCVWELADHARRRGALADPEGRVRLSWAVDGPVTAFSWVETDCGAEPATRALERRLVSERLAWRCERAGGLVQWTVRFETRAVTPALPRVARAA
jgi:two-component sensor histidine kinase